VSKKPELVIVAGPNGSGKTSVTEQLLLHTWTENSAKGFKTMMGLK